MMSDDGRPRLRLEPGGELWFVWRRENITHCSVVQCLTPEYLDHWPGYYMWTRPKTGARRRTYHPLLCGSVPHPWFTMTSTNTMNKAETKNIIIVLILTFGLINMYAITPNLSLSQSSSHFRTVIKPNHAFSYLKWQNDNTDMSTLN